MIRTVACTRHDQPGTADPYLREVLADASTRAGADLSPDLLALYMHDGELIATWETAGGRAAGRQALSDAWESKAGDRRILHLIPTDADYDYQEDVVDNGED